MWLGMIERVLFRSTQLIVVAFLVAVSCDSVEEKSLPEFQSKYSIDFDQDDQLEFYYNAKPAFNFARIHKDSIDLLLCTNRKQNSIDFYRMDSGFKIDSILLSLEGPNGLPGLNNFLYESDTIYAINAFAYELILFNTEGVALKRIRIKPEKQEESVLPRYFSPMELVKEGDVVYISGDPDLDIRNQESYKRGKYTYEVNIKTGQSRSVFGVPAIYHEDQWMVNQYFYRNLYDKEKRQWIFSFEVDDSLRVYSINEKVKAFYAGSQLSGEIEKWNKEDLNSEKAYSYYLRNKVYGKLIYDRKNELYYRFVNHPNQDAIANRDIDRMWNRRYSIVILDKKFNWLGETEIKDEAYEQGHISTDNGVYLSYFREKEAIEGVKKYIKMNPVDLNEN